MAPSRPRSETSRPRPHKRRRSLYRRWFTRLVPRLPLPRGMVDTIIRLTVLAVLALAFANAVHAVVVFVRLARHLAACSPHGGLAFWLPAFGSMRDARVW